MQMITESTTPLVEYSRTGKLITELDRVLDKIVTGLIIVTTKYEGIPYGMTAAWFSRASNNPYMVMISISKSSCTMAHVEKSKIFAINIIDDSQKALADFFGNNTGREINKFEKISYSKWKSGAPILEKNACSAIDCKVVNQIESGDHMVFLGEVLEGKSLSKREPYLYNRKDFL